MKNILLISTIILANIIILIALLFLSVIVPSLESIYVHLNARLPLYTKYLVDMSFFVRDNFIFVSIGILFLIGLSILFIIKISKIDLVHNNKYYWLYLVINIFFIVILASIPFLLLFFSYIGNIHIDYI